MGIEIETLVSHCRYEDVLPLRQKAGTPSFAFEPKSVVVCVFPYRTGDYPERNVAGYAIVNDYHDVAGEILRRLAKQLAAAFPREGFVCLIDSSPIPEVRAAHAAGLGVIGRHGMLIHEKYGSRVFIGTIVTSLALNPKPFAAKTCLNCMKCINACPTGALSAEKPLNTALCRSHITQKKSNLSDWEQNEIKRGGLAWGCDICTDACPMNQNTAKTPIRTFYHNIVPVVTTQNLSAIIRDKPYNWRGEAILLRNLELLASR